MNVILSVDAIHPPLTGIGHYALQLYRGLRAHSDIEQVRCAGLAGWLDDPEAALRACGTQDTTASSSSWLAGLRRHVPAKGLLGPVYLKLRGWQFQRSAARYRDHVFHGPNYFTHPHSGPSVVTVHDLSHIHYPQWHPKARLQLLAHALPRALARADRVITVSEYVRREVIERYQLPDERVVAVHNGVDAAFAVRSAAQTAEVLLATRGLRHGEYLLSVGTLEPRKNLTHLVTAYAALPEATRRRYPLVLVGTRGWGEALPSRQIEHLLAAGQLVLLGYVPQAALPLIYAGARAVAYVSHYEGFGLPVLEGMASGVPVLTANTSAMPEVAGGAALCVDPKSVEAILAGLQQVLEDEALRTQLQAAGPLRAQSFSWQRCVAETVGVYREALGGEGDENSLRENRL